MPQIIEDRYIDRSRLMILLESLFPNGDYTAQVRSILKSRPVRN
jgi:hypothetical protein